MIMVKLAISLIKYESQSGSEWEDEGMLCIDKLALEIDTFFGNGCSKSVDYLSNLIKKKRNFYAFDCIYWYEMNMHEIPHCKNDEQNKISHGRISGYISVRT